MSVTRPNLNHVKTAIRLLKPCAPVLLLTTAVISVGAYFFIDQNRRNFHNELRYSVHHQLDLILSKLKGEINSTLGGLTVLSGTLAIDDDINEEHFERHAMDMAQRNPAILRISAAPNGIIRYVYPQTDSAGLVGTDLKDIVRMRQLPAEVASVPSRSSLIAPVTTDGGEKVLNLFLPVVSTRDGRPVRWGVVDVMLDRDRIFKRAELVASSTRNADQRDFIEVAIRDISTDDPNPQLLFGDQGVFDRSPARRHLTLPGSIWEIAAAPSGGWNQSPPNEEKLALTIVFLTSMVLLSIVLTARLAAERRRSMATLRSRDRELLTISHHLNLSLETSGIGLWEIDVDAQSRQWDARMMSMHGLSATDGAGAPIGDSWLALIHRADREAAREMLEVALRTEQTYRSQYRVVHPDGRIGHIRSIGAVHRGQDGLARMTGVSWDVTDDVRMTLELLAAKQAADETNTELSRALNDLREREQRLEDMSRRLDLALAAYQCGMWEIDTKAKTTFWDDRMYRLHGLVPGSVTVTAGVWQDLMHEDDRQTALGLIRESLLDDTPRRYDVRILLPDGTLRHVRAVGQGHTGPDGVRRLIGIAVDTTADVVLTEQLRSAKALADENNRKLATAKDRIEHNALHDPLTGLGNRRMLDLRLETLLSFAGDAPSRVTLLHIDLDRFKQINDTLGHAAGDAMLVHASNIIKANVRAEDMVARIGGDEFVVVLNDLCDRAELTALANRIITQMRQPVNYEGFPCRFGVSIGIAVAGNATDARKLLVNADIALYRAKQNGRNRYEFFTNILEAEVVRTKRIADDLLMAVEENQFVVWYQPQFQAGTLQLAGVEALVRWDHPRDGLLTPDKFLGIAEELNIMPVLDRMVLDRALLDAVRWRRMGIDVPKISVNVSAKRLADENLLDTLADLRFTPGQLCFELVESIFLDENDDCVTSNITGIKNLGIDIEIDDFGTGHTSIVGLLKTKPKRLKIDRQLVAPLFTNPKQQGLIRSIIEIGRSLNIEIVAEGVETMQHAELLGMLGCHVLQGYAFSRPLSFDAFVTFIDGEARNLAS